MSKKALNKQGNRGHKNRRSGTPRRARLFSVGIRFLAGFLVVVLVSLLAFRNPSQAYTTEFYANSCLGGWSNPTNAVGKPDSTDLTPINTTNAAVVFPNQGSQIFCGDFQGDIPENSFPKEVKAKFVWDVRNDLIQHEIDLLESSETPLVVEPELPESDEADGETVIDEDQGPGEEEEFESNSDPEVTEPASPKSASEEKDPVVVTPTEEPIEEVPATEPDLEQSVSASADTSTDVPVEEEAPAENTTVVEPAPVVSEDPAPVESTEEPVTQTKRFRWFKQAFAQEEPAQSTESPLVETDPVEVDTNDKADPIPTKESEAQKTLNERILETLQSQEKKKEPTPEITTNVADDGNATNSSGDVDPASPDAEPADSNLEQEDVEVFAPLDTESTDEEPEPLIDPYSEFLEVSYTINGTDWHPLGNVNWLNWREAEFTIPSYDFLAWEDLSRLQISLQTIPSLDIQPYIYLDAMYLSVEYQDLDDDPVTRLQLQDGLEILPDNTIVVPSTSLIPVTKQNFATGENPVFNLDTKSFEDFVGVPQEPAETVNTPEDIESTPAEESPDNASEDTLDIETEAEISEPAIDPETSPDADTREPSEPTEETPATTTEDVEVQAFRHQQEKLLGMLRSAQETVTAALDIRPVYAQLPTSSITLIQVKVRHSNGTVVPVTPAITQSQSGLKIAVPKPLNNFVPGKYFLDITLDLDGQLYTTTQEFTWGVLLINLDQNIYQPKTPVVLQFETLNERGNQICNDELLAVIQSPNGQTYEFTSFDGTIVRSDTCTNYSINPTDPDYWLEFENTDLLGEYIVTLTNVTRGYTLQDAFTVKSFPDFIIRRSSPSRINPFSTSQTMTISLTSRKDFSGLITEEVPATFQIQSHNGETTKSTDLQQIIQWDLDLLANESVDLTYTYQTPSDSPVLYRLGPLVISEQGSWIEDLLLSPEPTYTSNRTWNLTANSQIARPDQLSDSSESWIGDYTDLVGIDTACTTYVETTGSTSDEFFEIGLSDIAPPNPSTPQILRYSYQKSADTDTPQNITVSLYQGETVIASWNHINISTTPTSYTQKLSDEQIALITDYGDLRVRLFAAPTAGKVLPFYWCGAQFEALDTHGVTVFTQGNVPPRVDVNSNDNALRAQFVVQNHNPEPVILQELQLSEVGSIKETRDIDEITVYSELDTQEPYDCVDESFSDTEKNFGQTIVDGFPTKSGSVTFQGEVTLEPNSALCLYVVVGIGPKAKSGDTIAFELSNPMTSVRLYPDTIATQDTVRLSGVTTIQDPATIPDLIPSEREAIVTSPIPVHRDLTLPEDIVINESCQVNPFNIDITDVSEGSTEISFTEKSIAFDNAQIGSTPAGILVTFTQSDEPDYDPRRSKKTFKVSVTKQPGASQGSFNIPIIFTSTNPKADNPAALMCQINVINN